MRCARTENPSVALRSPLSSSAIQTIHSAYLWNTLRVCMGAVWDIACRTARRLLTGIEKRRTSNTTRLAWTHITRIRNLVRLAYVVCFPSLLKIFANGKVRCSSNEHHTDRMHRQIVCSQFFCYIWQVLHSAHPWLNLQNAFIFTQWILRVYIMYE